jgi:hypothetical protein
MGARDDITGGNQWFVYEGRRHHGPYDDDGIKRGLEGHRISKASYLWTEGFSDWEPIDKIELFRDYLIGIPLQFDDYTSSSLHEESLEPADFSEPLAGPIMNRPPIQNFVFIPQYSGEPPQIVSEANLKSENVLVPNPGLSKNRSKLKFVYAGALLIAALGSAIAFKVFSNNTLPPVYDVSSGEYGELKAVVANGDALSQQPQVAIALSIADIESPQFYIASNLPDQTTLEILLEGIPETLLQKFNLVKHASVTVKNGLAKTPAFHDDNGASLPLGEYQVSVKCQTCIAKHKLAVRQYFLGGTRNRRYDELLLNYHQRISEQATAELLDLNQLVSTLEQQLTESNDEFESAIDTNNLSSWDEFHRNWIVLQSQIGLLLAAPSGQNQKSIRYYSGYYAFATQISQLVDKIHSAQESYLHLETKAVEAVNIIDSDISISRTMILAIKAKLTLLERRSPSSTGMPPLEEPIAVRSDKE